MIIRDIHMDINHSSHTNHIFSMLGKYRLVKAQRETIWSLLKQCFGCICLWTQSQLQQMGQLPDYQVPQGKLDPFSISSMDAAGPFETKQGKGKMRTRRYLLIFTCTVTRAIHIEVMYGLSAEDPGQHTSFVTMPDNLSKEPNY